MVILNKWREGRMSSLRKEFEEAIAKAPGPDAPARSAFLSNITQTHATLLTLYSAATPAERGAILRFVKNAATGMWRQGAWPLALGLEIACLNAASHFESGADAAYVKAETDKIILEAVLTQKSINRVDRPATEGLGGDAHDAARLTPRHSQTGRHYLRELANEARQIKQAAFAKIAHQMLPLDREFYR